MFVLLSMEFFQSRKVRSEQYRPDSQEKKCTLQANILAADLFTFATRLQVIALGLMQNPHSVHWHKAFGKQLLTMLTATALHICFLIFHLTADGSLAKPDNRKNYISQTLV